MSWADEANVPCTNRQGRETRRRTFTAGRWLFPPKAETGPKRRDLSFSAGTAVKTGPQLPSSLFRSLPRFIPAPAGNSWTCIRLQVYTTVHPRACGEQALPRACGEQALRSASRISLIGSSPRLRGTVDLPAGDIGEIRFIPAPAGNRNLPTRNLPMPSVHPRACGEQPHRSGPKVYHHGSSPRLRGTACPGGVEPSVDRFIPAPAGNSGGPTPRRLRSPVHPRACGEQNPIYSALDIAFGSSPRLRGTGLGPGQARAPARFIPAPAGNSRVVPEESGSAPVHPRACGEQSCWGPSPSFPSGSSPRLRGTAMPMATSRSPRRFIPAPAGNSDDEMLRRAVVAVHPRACGEQIPQRYFSNWTDGSSPRLRGTGAWFMLHRLREAVHPRACGEQPTWMMA